MLQTFAEEYRRCIRELVLPAVVLAVIFAVPNGAFASEAESQLMEAAESGDAAEVERLLADGADVNYQNENGATVLYIASSEGHGEIVDALLAKSATLDVQANNGATALYIASQEGRGTIVETLLAKGAALDVQANGGAIALYIASQKGHGAIVDALLAKGAAIDKQIDNGATALVVASTDAHCATLVGSHRESSGESRPKWVHTAVQPAIIQPGTAQLGEYRISGGRCGV